MRMVACLSQSSVGNPSSANSLEDTDVDRKALTVDDTYLGRTIIIREDNT